MAALKVGGLNVAVERAWCILASCSTRIANKRLWSKKNATSASLHHFRQGGDNVLIMLVIATAGAFVGFATFPRDSENEAAQISYGEERDSIFLFGKHYDYDYDYDYNYDYDYDYDYYGTCGKLGAVCTDSPEAPCCSEFKCLTRFNHPYLDGGVKRCDIPELPQARLPSPPSPMPIPPPPMPIPPPPAAEWNMGHFLYANLGDVDPSVHSENAAG